MKVLLHALCGRFAGGCPISVAGFPTANHAQKAFNVLLGELRREQSDKRLAMAQLGVYHGFRSTHAGAVHADRKVAKLMLDLEESAAFVQPTPPDIR